MTPEQAYIKCNNKRNRYLEQYIIKDSHYAYFYALNIIKGRWIEAEDIIATNSGYAYLYAREIIKGKLPENMHNMMLLYADKYSKKYFDYIKNKPQP
jgi:hypothetical protein